MIFPKICLHRQFNAQAQLFAFAVLAGALLGGCDRSTTDRDIVWVTPQDAIRMAATPQGTFGSGGAPRTLWLDPRMPNQFAEGHLPSAVNIPFPEISKTHESTCKNFELFIVYDSDYDDVMAKAASKRLLELGYDGVFTIRGGIKAWQREGYELQKDPAIVAQPK